MNELAVELAKFCFAGLSIPVAWLTVMDFFK